MLVRGLCLILLPLLSGAVRAQGFSDADIAVLARQSIVSDSRLQALSADALGRASNRRPDLDVARDVRLVLKKRLGTSLETLTVTCQHGEVALLGRADTSDTAQRAEQLAAAVAGARGVTNRLSAPDVEPAAAAPYQASTATGPARSDAFDFLTLDGLAGRDVVLDVARGEVTLTGLASSPVARDYATSAARRVPGVRLVRNSMEVRSRSRADDERLSKLILRRLEWSEDLRSVSRDLDVKVQDGIVRLTGRVDSARQRDAAVDLAGSTAGVVAVDDRLTGGTR